MAEAHGPPPAGEVDGPPPAGEVDGPPPAGEVDPWASFRSGFVSVVGRPNVGKSTLVNRILGTKVTITSPRPNTTRRSVRGVLHRPGLQAVLVDTPGLHKPRSTLGERLNDHVAEALDEVDVAVAVLDATMALGPGDRLVLQRAATSVAEGPPGVPDRLWRLLVVVNKVDVASPAAVLRQLAAAASTVAAAGVPGAAAVGPEGAQAAAGAGGAREPSDPGVEYFPVSAVTGAGVDAVVEAVLARLPAGPPYFPADAVTDVPEAFWVAELVREQLLAVAREELPHAIACRVTEWEWPRVRVEILVERESQKAMVIGRGGRVLKEVGTSVRRQLPPGAYLELHVTVERRWQMRPDRIDQLGY